MSSTSSKPVGSRVRNHDSDPTARSDPHVHAVTGSDRSVRVRRLHAVSDHRRCLQSERGLAPRARTHAYVVGGRDGVRRPSSLLAWSASQSQSVPVGVHGWASRPDWPGAPSSSPSSQRSPSRCSWPAGRTSSAPWLSDSPSKAGTGSIRSSAGAGTALMPRLGGVRRRRRHLRARLSAQTQGEHS